MGSPVEVGATGLAELRFAGWAGSLWVPYLCSEAAYLFPAYKVASARLCCLTAFLTVDTCQRPPRAVGMPRAFRAFAIPPKLVMPDAWIARITGSTFAAKRSASEIWISRPSAAAAFLGFPSLAPLCFRAASAAVVRSPMSGEKLRFERALERRSADPVTAVVVFKRAVIEAVRFSSFHRADNIADGLAYIWSEPHKWQVIAAHLGLSTKAARETVNSIADR